jgi:glycosyltransferase involved in cell wall biosynthesis
MLGFYEALDIFVLPSLDSEGLSLAQLEAMAAALPVIVTDVAGATEATRHKVEGLVVNPGDHSALRDALRALIRDAAQRRAMGDAGRERVRVSFDAPSMAEEVTRQYQSLLEETRMRSSRGRGHQFMRAE